MAIGFSVFFAPSRNVGCKKSSASSGPSNFWSWTSTGSRRSSLKLSVNNELSTPVRPVLSMLGCLGDWALLESRLPRLSATGFNARLGSWLLMIRKWDFNPTDLLRSWAVGKNSKPCKNVMALRNLYHVRLRSLSESQSYQWRRLQSEEFEIFADIYILLKRFRKRSLRNSTDCKLLTSKWFVKAFFKNLLFPH